MTQPSQYRTLFLCAIKDRGELVHIVTGPQGNYESLRVFVGKPADMREQRRAGGIEHYTHGAWLIPTHNHGDAFRAFYWPGASSGGRELQPTWNGQPLLELEPDNYRFSIADRWPNSRMTIASKNPAQPGQAVFAAAS